MAFGDNKEPKRVHFINLMKSTKDFSGEHLAPLSETDCINLISNKGIIDGLNAKLKDTGFSVQLNWSENDGKTWTQYPVSR